MKVKRFAALVILVAAAVSLVAATGSAQTNTAKAGVLTCTVEGGAGFVFGSSKGIFCDFSAEGGGKPERYAGSINKFGIDIGVTGKASLTWWVYAPTSKLGKGALAGSYSGAAADVAVGVGGGANVLVGGSQNTISLQPLSLQGETGVNAALAVASIELRRAQ
jgi:hypothetical protein